MTFPTISPNAVADKTQSRPFPARAVKGVESAGHKQDRPRETARLRATAHNKAGDGPASRTLIEFGRDAVGQVRASQECACEAERVLEGKET